MANLKKIAVIGGTGAQGMPVVKGNSIGWITCPRPALTSN